MAGDHKCSVCQATFTRPQHVSRHMRSHTGDRPYKCQHCGDQFARSDLLSRHINKCHPNEKPLVSSTPSRRKGTSSASRATTSKQACDQCVQSTLPCDGANPCSKCLHRKTRCTYVKFHRQTAPLGPGHPARPPHDSSNPAHPPLGALPLGLGPYRLSDPFFLANNGSALNPSALSQSNPLYADHQFSFPPPPQAPAPTYDTSFDYTARYRAQADFLSRTGVIPQERPPPLPAIYQESQAPHDPTTAARYSQSFPLNNDPQDYPLPPSPNRVDYGYNIDNKSEYPNNVLGYSANGYNPHDPLTFNNDTQIHQRCESSASDTGSTTSRSQTSSATSSSVHLPLAADYSQQQSYSRPLTADGVVQDREGFSSAFGLMSLDDSEVLAGLGEGAPFFDNAITNGSSSHNPSWGDGPTPRANPCDAPPANGKKRSHQQQQQQDLSHGQVGNGLAGTPASLKELKEIWKQYMKTPFSGQPLAHDHHPAGSPKRERGLSRVASLPSVKTPSIATAGWADPMRGVNGALPPPPPPPQQQQANGTNSTQHGGNAAHSRVYNHTDDLRSYEQAVLARRAPLTLHLAPRRRGNTTSTGPPVPPPPVSSTTAPPPGKGNRASPAGSGSGSDRSLSAFTDDRGGSSRASPTSSGGPNGADDASRPTFKRLPSQTLGPEYAKRAATANMLSGTRESFPSVVGEQEMLQRGFGGVSERARRMSFPSGRAGLIGVQD